MTAPVSVLSASLAVLLAAPYVNRTYVLGGTRNKVLPFLSAVGVCLCALEIFQRKIEPLLEFRAVTAFLERANIAEETVRSSALVCAIFMAIAGGFFVYRFLSLFFRALQKNADIAKIVRELTGREKAFYGFLILSEFALIAYVFLTVPDAYMANVYSSDGRPLFIEENAFLYLSNGENDFRQPLFAMFAAPFNGAPYAVASLFPAIPAMKPLLMNCAQYLMLFAADILLARIMGLDEKERICFLSIVSLSYPHILFGMIVEQYMVVYFYLILAFYVLSRRKECNPLIFCAASGTLLTGFVLAPLFSDASPFRDLKKWLSDMRRLFVSFAFLFIASCQLTSLVRLVDSVVKYRSFAVGLPWSERFLQYVHFISSCFVAPTAMAIDSAYFNLAPIERLSPFGLAVLILLCVSFALNRKDLACRYAFGWLAFSFLILCAIGWGSVENNMPLYSLYFSWANFVLLYRLFQKLAEKLRRAWILYACCAVMALFLLYRNIQGMRLLMDYFAQFTPEDMLETGV